MKMKKYTCLWWGGCLALILGFGFLLTGCSSSENEVTEPTGPRTQLLVRAPDNPLPINQPVTVRSRTEDPGGVSHVELYAVQTPSGERDLMLRADRVSFAQTSFIAAQTFTPLQAGHYVIKVVGYNLAGETAESDFIGFEVE
jgi:hypothetical protein